MHSVRKELIFRALTVLSCDYRSFNRISKIACPFYSLTQSDIVPVRLSFISTCLLRKVPYKIWFGILMPMVTPQRDIERTCSCTTPRASFRFERLALPDPTTCLIQNLISFSPFLYLHSVSFFSPRGRRSFTWNYAFSSRLILDSSFQHPGEEALASGIANSPYSFAIPSPRMHLGITSRFFPKCVQ